MELLISPTQKQQLFKKKNRNVATVKKCIFWCSLPRYAEGFTASDVKSQIHLIFQQTSISCWGSGARCNRVYVVCTTVI